MDPNCNLGWENDDNPLELEVQYPIFRQAYVATLRGLSLPRRVFLCQLAPFQCKILCAFRGKF